MTTVLISGQVVNVSEEEKKIYETLTREFGRDAFNGLIKTDEENNIALIDLTKNTKVSFSIMYFLITLSVNQRLNKIDEAVALIRSIEDRVRALESLEERVRALELGISRPECAAARRRN